MNKVIISFQNRKSKEVKTKLTDSEKIINFLKITGVWSSDITDIELVENIESTSCNYQNMDTEQE